jgi:Cu+-exporting ATPase
VEPLGSLRRERALELAVALERGAEHPIARSLRKAWRERAAAELPEVSEFRVLPGVGVAGEIEGARHELRRDERASELGETSIVLVREGELLARLRLRDHVRSEAREVVQQLARDGYELGVLTGDDRGAADALERELGLSVDARLTPIDKVARIRAAGRGTVFVGDGLNDAAALAAADVGISVAGSTHTTLGAADVNLLRPGLDELPRTLALARSAVAAARFNLAWAFAYNGVGLWLAASGRLTPIFAASAMVASSAVSVLSSSRLRGAAREAVRQATGAAELRTPAYGASA